MQLDSLVCMTGEQADVRNEEIAELRAAADGEREQFKQVRSTVGPGIWLLFGHPLPEYDISQRLRSCGRPRTASATSSSRSAFSLLHPSVQPRSLA